MRKHIFILGLMLFCVNSIIYSQITTEEQPIGLRSKYRNLSNKEIVQITPPNITKVLKEDAKNTKNNFIERFAVAVNSNFNSDTDGEWINLPDGGLLWQLTLNLENAQSLNLVFDKFWLPPKGKFFVYNIDTKESVGAVTSEFLRGTKKILPNLPLV